MMRIRFATRKGKHGIDHNQSNNVTEELDPTHDNRVIIHMIYHKDNRIDNDNDRDKLLRRSNRYMSYVVNVVTNMVTVSSKVYLEGN